MFGKVWQCHKCGKVEGFILLGKGIVKCSGCGAVHFVAWGGCFTSPGTRGFLMNKSLCNHQYCPGICERVCHCPAGLTRSHAHLAMYRNRREMVRQPSPQVRPCPPGVNPETGEIYQVNHRIDQAKEFALFQLFGRRSRRRQHHANLPCIGLAFLVFAGLVLLAGFLVNGVSTIPHYEYHQTPSSGWYWDCERGQWYR